MMSRAEELTGRLIDGEATPPEREELRRLIEDDPEARRAHLTLMHTEGLLRGRQPTDVTEAVMARVAGAAAALAVAVAPVVVPAPAAPRPTRAVRAPQPRRRWWPVALALGLGSAAFALWGLPRLLRPRVQPTARLERAARPDRAAAPGSSGSVQAAGRAKPGLALGARGPALAPSLTADLPRLTAPAAESPATLPAPTTVLAIDFDQLLPGMKLVHGQVVSEPCAPVGARCVLGGMSWNAPDTNAVTLSRYKPHVTTYADTRVVSFDYRIGKDALHVAVQVWNAERNQNYHVTLIDVVQGQWAHAEARLADFVGNARRGEPMQAGDWLQDLMVVAGRLGGEPLYVANFKILEYAPEALPLASTGGAARAGR